GTILLSGAIAKGQSILAAQALGADLAYMGTRFIASQEANAEPDYKEMLVEGMYSIANGESPRSIEIKLSSYQLS
ncbi:MAG: hypothetical protein MJK04_29510, partial [Psychrosphaera sp.]|nr:hypothetical protein [Psychrosphaera sp.]